VLTRQAAAAVSAGTYWPRETTATLRSARLPEALRRPQREERGGAYHEAAGYSLFFVESLTNQKLSLMSALWWWHRVIHWTASQWCSRCCHYDSFIILKIQDAILYLKDTFRKYLEKL